MTKTYLGDGLYVQEGPYPGSFTLTAENGVEVQDTIVLDENTIPALAQFIGTTTTFKIVDNFIIGRH